MRRSFPTVMAITLAIVYFLNNVALGSMAESNFWTQRRNEIRQPLQILNQLPALHSALPLSPASNFLPETDLNRPAGLRTVMDSLPQNAGSIQDIFCPHHPAGPPIVLIQDVHLNTEAQSNIAVLLQALLERVSIGLIGVEGSFQPFDFRPFRKYSNKHVTELAARSFLDQNLLAAPSFVGITSAVEPPLFLGVDDKQHYDANLQALYAARDSQKRTMAQLRIAVDALEKNKKNIFSAKLYEFDRLRDAYHKGNVGLSAYLERLTHESPGTEFDVDVQRFLAARSLEKKLDFDKIEVERRAVVEQLLQKLNERETSNLISQSLAYKTGALRFGMYYEALRRWCAAKNIDLRRTPNFETYIRYVLLADGINANRLFSAIKKLETQTIERLCTSTSERQLGLASQHLMLTEKLLNFSLTPEEWEEYERELPTTNARSAALSPFERFYIEADIRSAKMVNNLLARPTRAPMALALVVGGFHSSRVAALLRRRNIPYVIVSPKLTKIDMASGTAYLSVFARDRTPLDRLFAGEKLFVYPRHVAITDPEMSALVGGVMELEQQAHSGSGLVPDKNWTHDGCTYNAHHEDVHGNRDGSRGGDGLHVLHTTVRKQTPLLSRLRKHLGDPLKVLVMAASGISFLASGGSVQAQTPAGAGRLATQLPPARITQDQGDQDEASVPLLDDGASWKKVRGFLEENKFDEAESYAQQVTDFYERTNMIETIVEAWRNVQPRSPAEIAERITTAAKGDLILQTRLFLNANMIAEAHEVAKKIHTTSIGSVLAEVARRQKKNGDLRGHQQTVQEILRVSVASPSDRYEYLARAGAPEIAYEAIRKLPDNEWRLGVVRLVAGWRDYRSDLNLDWLRDRPARKLNIFVMSEAAHNLFYRAPVLENKALGRGYLDQAQLELMLIADPLDRAQAASDLIIKLRLYEMDNRALETLESTVAAVKTALLHGGDKGKIALYELASQYEQLNQDEKSRELRNEIYPRPQAYGRSTRSQDAPSVDTHSDSNTVDGSSHLAILFWLSLKIFSWFVMPFMIVVAFITRYGSRVIIEFCTFVLIPLTSSSPQWALAWFDKDDWERLAKRFPNKAGPMIKKYLEEKNITNDKKIDLLYALSFVHYPDVLPVLQSLWISFPELVNYALKAQGERSVNVCLHLLKERYQRPSHGLENLTLDLMQKYPSAVSAETVDTLVRCSDSNLRTKIPEFLIDYFKSHPNAVSPAYVQLFIDWNDHGLLSHRLAPVILTMTQVAPALMRDPNIRDRIIERIAHQHQSRPYSWMFWYYTNAIASDFTYELDKPAAEQSQDLALIGANLGWYLGDGRLERLWARKTMRRLLFGPSGLFQRTRDLRVNPGHNVCEKLLTYVDGLFARIPRSSEAIPQRSQEIKDELKNLKDLVRIGRNDSGDLLTAVVAGEIRYPTLRLILDTASKPPELVRVIEVMSEANTPAKIAARERYLAPRLAWLKQNFESEWLVYLEGAAELIYSGSLVPSDVDQLYDDLLLYHENFSGFYLNVFRYFQDHKTEAAQIRADIAENIKGLAWNHGKSLGEAFRKKYEVTGRQQAQFWAAYMPYRGGIKEVINQADNLNQSVSVRQRKQKAEVDPVFRDQVLISRFPKQVLALKVDSTLDTSWMETWNNACLRTENSRTDSLEQMIDGFLRTGEWPSDQQILRSMVAYLSRTDSFSPFVASVRERLEQSDLSPAAYVALIGDIQTLVQEWKIVHSPVIKEKSKELAAKAAADGQLLIGQHVTQMRTSKRNRDVLRRIAGDVVSGKLNYDDITTRLLNELDLKKIDKQDLLNGAIPFWAAFCGDASRLDGERLTGLIKAVTIALRTVSRENPPEGQIVNNSVPDQVMAKLDSIAASSLRDLRAETDKFEMRVSDTEFSSIIAGLYDSAFYFTACFATGLCTRLDRARAIREDDAYPMELSIQIPGIHHGGKVLGSGLVQLLKWRWLVDNDEAPLPGYDDRHTRQGWRILAVPSINMLDSIVDHDIGKRLGTQVTLEYAQRIAAETGIPAVTAASSWVRHQNPDGPEAKLTQEYIQKGWLKPARLDRAVRVGFDRHTENSYSDVYIIDIPEDQMVTRRWKLQSMTTLLEGDEEMPAVANDETSVMRLPITNFEQAVRKIRPVYNLWHELKTVTTEFLFYQLLPWLSAYLYPELLHDVWGVGLVWVVAVVIAAAFVMAHPEEDKTRQFLLFVVGISLQTTFLWPGVLPRMGAWSAPLPIGLHLVYDHLIWTLRWLSRRAFFQRKTPWLEDVAYWLPLANISHPAVSVSLTSKQQTARWFAGVLTALSKRRFSDVLSESDETGLIRLDDIVGARSKQPACSLADLHEWAFDAEFLSFVQANLPADFHLDVKESELILAIFTATGLPDDAATAFMNLLTKRHTVVLFDDTVTQDQLDASISAAHWGNKSVRFVVSPNLEEKLDRMLTQTRRRTRNKLPPFEKIVNGSFYRTKDGRLIFDGPSFEKQSALSLNDIALLHSAFIDIDTGGAHPLQIQLDDLVPILRYRNFDTLIRDIAQALLTAA